MKKTVAIILTMAFMLNAIPAFAAQPQGGAAKEKTLFQVIKDSIDKEYNAREKKPFKGDVTVFEDVKAGLKSLDESSAKAKSLSLREPKQAATKERKSVK